MNEKQPHTCAICGATTTTSICASCAHDLSAEAAENIPGPDVDPITIGQDEVLRLRHVIATRAERLSSVATAG